jgi:hypothetical protein
MVDYKKAFLHKLQRAVEYCELKCKFNQLQKNDREVSLNGFIYGSAENEI